MPSGAGAPGRFGPLQLGDLACQLLAPEQGPLEAPVRSVIFGAARFSEHGRSLAQAQNVAPAGAQRGSFFPRLQQNLQVLRANDYVSLRDGETTRTLTTAERQQQIAENEAAETEHCAPEIDDEG